MVMTNGILPQADATSEIWIKPSLFPYSSSSTKARNHDPFYTANNIVICFGPTALFHHSKNLNDLCFTNAFSTCGLRKCSSANKTCYCGACNHENYLLVLTVIAFLLFKNLLFGSILRLHYFEFT